MTTIVSRVSTIALDSSLDLGEIRHRHIDHDPGEIALRHHFRGECPLIGVGSVSGARGSRERVREPVGGRALVLHTDGSGAREHGLLLLRFLPSARGVFLPKR